MLDKSYRLFIYAEKNRQRLKRNKLYGKKVLRRFKTMKGCATCGYKGHHAALEFNHRVPESKVLTISTEAMCVSLRNTAASKIRFKKEIEKCDVLCAICHRIVTYENKHQVSDRYK
tara:strand:- start:70 stop:417 length:348 start_codon:yes stop_codon:yes gene_type:complete